MGEPVVSVIIPCYNQAKFLGEAIESVLKQNYRRLEVIVIDDGSTDGTAEVADRYSDVIRISQENRGLAAARNRGLSQSTGDYLVFLDADDRLLPEALAVGVRSLDTHPECAFVYGRSRWVSVDGAPVPAPPQYSMGEEPYRSLLERNCVWGCMTVMFRRSVLEAVSGFDASLASAEDSDLYLRIARKFPVYFHGTVVAEYRRHEANMSKNAAAMLRSVLRVLRSQQQYVKANRQYKQAYKNGIKLHQELYGERLAEHVRFSIRARKHAHAFRGILTLARYYPSGLAKHAFRKTYCLIMRNERTPHQVEPNE